MIVIDIVWFKESKILLWVKLKLTPPLWWTMMMITIIHYRLKWLIVVVVIIFVFVLIPMICWWVVKINQKKCLSMFVSSIEKNRCLWFLFLINVFLWIIEWSLFYFVFQCLQKMKLNWFNDLYWCFYLEFINWMQPGVFIIKSFWFRIIIFGLTRKNFISF